MKCLNCKAKISDKAKFCSDKCRMAYRRRTKQGEQPEQNDPEHQPEQIEGLTKTDALFEKSKPGYYKFSENVRMAKCHHPDCGKQFKTSLSLLKFCSPEHMLDILKGRWIELA